MNRENFNPRVGDFVRVREWDDMKSEFGLNGNDIDCECSFVTNMRYLCGEEFQITSITKDNTYLGLNTYWTISKDMLEPVEDDTPFDTEEIESFFSEIVVK